jgi:hypothetical protein
MLDSNAADGIGDSGSASGAETPPAKPAAKPPAKNAPARRPAATRKPSANGNKTSSSHVAKPEESAPLVPGGGRANDELAENHPTAPDMNKKAFDLVAKATVKILSPQSDDL